MSNSLTGDYEAIFQVSVQQLNGLLASMHQSRIDPAAQATFAHSGSIRIGDTPAGLLTEAVQFRNWATEVVRHAEPGGGAPADAGMVLLKHTPPGLGAAVTTAWQGLVDARVDMASSTSARGQVDFQVSTPTIAFSPGATDAVTVLANVRARYIADPGAAPLPEPIHGEVRAVYLVTPKALQAGRRALSVKVSPDDALLQFVPAPGGGLSAAEAASISEHLRKTLRQHFAPADVELPPDFAFSAFKALGNGNTVALPLQLSGAPLPPGGLSGLNTDLLAGSEFAVAVSRNYVQGFLDQIIDQMKAVAAASRTTVTVALVEATYTASVSNVTFTWKPGAIEIGGRIDLETDSAAPNGYIDFRQAVTLVLNVPGQQLSVVAVGEPWVDESWWMPHDKAVQAVKQARDAALSPAGGPLNATFGSAAARLQAGLASFDKYATARYSAVEIVPDGIILRGSIKTSGRLDPIVHVAEIDGGTAFSALRSWIPGGWIQRHTWSWVEMVHPIPWANKTSYAPPDEHRFVLPKPAGFANANRICLAVEGTRLTSDGLLESGVSGGETCTVTAHEPILTLPPGWAKLYVPIWVPDPPPFDFSMRDRIAAHVNLAGGSRARRLTANTLVHFPGARLEKPLETMARAVSAVRSEDRSLSIILVLPEGALERSRSDVESALGLAGERFAADLLITEDYGRGWSRTFGSAEGPASHLINAHGEFVWRHDGRLEIDALAGALAAHAVPAPPPRGAMLRLSIQPGGAPPDARLIDDRGHPMTLRRLRGKKVLLNFWQSWSAPSMTELQRLQEQQAEGSGTIVLAVCGDEDAAALAEARERYGFTFSLVHDRAQAISMLFDVRCWPTTLSINEEGIVDRIQFGLTHEHRGEHPRAT